MKVVKLPHGFFHDGILYNMAEIRGITGREQNHLINVDLVRKNQHISKILSSCVSSLSTEDGDKLDSPISGIIEKMLTTDRFFLMVQVRRESLGDKFHFEHTCMVCNKKTSYTQRLDNVEVKYAKDEESEYDIELPSGRKARVKLPTGKEEQKIFNIVEKHKDTIATSIIALSLKSIDDKVPTKDDLLDMPIIDSQFIADVLEERSSGLDEWVEFECPECHEEYKEPLPAGNPSFFSQPPKRKYSIEI